MSDLSDRLRQLRTGLGNGTDITQGELSKLIGINKSTVSGHENGHVVGVPDLIKYAKYYDVSVDWLLGITNIMRPSSGTNLLRALDAANSEASKSNVSLDPATLMDVFLHIRRYYAHGAPAGNAPMDLLNGFLLGFTEFVAAIDDHDSAAILEGANKVSEQLIQVNAAMHAYFADK